MPLKGPHNIDIYKNIIVWDYYEERFNLLAGFKDYMQKYKKNFNNILSLTI